MKQYKTCTKCGQFLPYTAFAKDSNKKSGLTSSCKACRNAYRKSRRENDSSYLKKEQARSRDYYHENKQSQRQRNRKWALSNKEKRKAIDASFRRNNRERQRLRALDYRKRNPTKRIKWARANPSRQAAIYAKRSFAKRGGVVYKVTLKELQNLYLSQCTYCNARAEHIDHVVPLSRGGQHSIGNLTGSCASCNLSKGSKFIMEWKRGRK